MQPLQVATVGMVLAALGGLSCRLGTPPDTRFVVETRDETGAPLAATRVYWYPPPGGSQSPPEHPAACLDSGCSRWGWESEPVGVFYVAAEWSAPHPAAGCQWSGYAAMPVERTATRTVTLRLTLERLESCV